MKFAHYDLGHLDRGDVVVVTLTGDSVNVRLLDASNFSSYKRGARHQYIGGHVTRSPHRISVPRSGVWHLAIDRGGYPVNVRHGVRVEKVGSRMLPPVQNAASPTLADIGRNLAEATGADDASITHDVFISHASEDKDDLVRPLAAALTERDVTVWFDELTMKVGDGLRRRIDRAVATSRFAVVVISPSFFAKHWTQYELDGLVAREMSGEQIILPIWHNITKDELLAISPSLTDKVALRTADLSIDEIADQLAEAVSASRHG